MARTVTLLKDHSDGIFTALDASSIPIGRAVAPRDLAGAEIDPPYAVMYLLAGGIMDGPISDSQADVELRVQITAVGKSEQQALVAQDICRAQMQKGNITITGRTVRNVRLALASNGIQRDDDLPVPLFYSYDQWEVDTTPE